MATVTAAPARHMGEMVSVEGLRASAIVRAKNEALQIERCLLGLRAQTVPVEIVVVDSGSTDATVKLAARHADELVRMKPDEFSFGRSLNVGASIASGDIHFALSAHCVPERDDWVARALTHHREDSRVAGTFGALGGPDGSPLAVPMKCYWPVAGEDPYWGFSNHASSWRASVWHRFRFDEEIEACEDREWSWRVMRAGYVLVADPLLFVRADHRRAAGFRALFDRTRREARALGSADGLARRYSIGDAARDWWSTFPAGSERPRHVRRMNPNRVIEIAGRWVGERDRARMLRE